MQRAKSISAAAFAACAVLCWSVVAPTMAAAQDLVKARLAQRFTADANDYIYAYDAARDYDPSPGLETIKARVLAINAADDERNPVELGIVAREIKRVKNGSYYEIPASAETIGHGTSGNGKWWKHLLPGLLSDAKPGPSGISNQ